MSPIKTFRQSAGYFAGGFIPGFSHELVQPVRSRANPGTQKDGRFVTGPQREAAARCARVEDVANLDLAVDIGSSDAVGSRLMLTR